MRKYIIYALIHPETKKPFYVGCTTQSLDARLRNHMQCAKDKWSSPVYEYINSLSKEPIIEMLDCNDSTTKGDALNQESFWTNKLRCEGHTLYNHNKRKVPRKKIRIHDFIKAGLI